MSRLLLVISVVLSNMFFMSSAVATEAFDPGTCSPGPTDTSICRSFRVDSGEFEGSVDFLQVQIHHYRTRDNASFAYRSLELAGYPANVAGQQFMGVELGNEYAYYPPAALDSGAGSAEHLMVREGNIITWWIAFGTDPDMSSVMLFTFLTTERPSEDTTRINAEDLADYLPAAEVLPKGFVLADEHLSNTDVATEPEPTRQAITRKPRTSSSGTTATVTPTPRPTADTSSHSSTTSGPIEIIDISGKDAGIGDGTIYIYVEIRNTSGRSLSYVHIDVGCRDSNGTVIGTGIANHLGLAPGETAVLTGIVLNVPGCDTIYAKVNPLTS